MKFYFSAIYFLILLSIPSKAQQVYPDPIISKSSVEELDHLPNNVMPVIGAWFMGENEFKAEGYKVFLDYVNINSCYDLLSTAIRISGRDITDIDVHNQVKKAVAYANELGIKIALELDLRLARRKFEAMYSDELQESLWLQEVKLSANEPVITVVRSNDLTDHLLHLCNRLL